MIRQYDIATGEVLAADDRHTDTPPEAMELAVPGLRLLTVSEAITTTRPEAGLPADVAMLPVDQLLARCR
jgi:hypothetical protein